MKNHTANTRQSAEQYGIAAVARQVGLAAPVIRMWEKRYGASAIAIRSLANPWSS